MNFVLFGKCRPTARVSVQRLHARFKVEYQKAQVEAKLADKEKKLDETNRLLEALREDKADIEQQARELEDKANQSELSWAHNMSYHLNGAMLDTMSQEFTSRYHHLPEETKSLFDDTLICQLAEQGNHVVMVALNLVCGYVDDATTIAQTHGGGGGPSTGWGRQDVCAICQTEEENVMVSLLAYDSINDY